MKAAIGNKVFYKLGFDGAACERLGTLNVIERARLVAELDRLAQVAQVRAEVKMRVKGQEGQRVNDSID